MERKLGLTGPSQGDQGFIKWCCHVLYERKKIVATILYSVLFPDNSEIPTTL